MKLWCTSTCTSRIIQVGVLVLVWFKNNFDNLYKSTSRSPVHVEITCICFKSHIKDTEIRIFGNKMDEHYRFFTFFNSKSIFNIKFLKILKWWIENQPKSWDTKCVHIKIIHFRHESLWMKHKHQYPACEGCLCRGILALEERLVTSTRRVQACTHSHPDNQCVEIWTNKFVHPTVSYMLQLCRLMFQPEKFVDG